MTSCKLVIGVYKGLYLACIMQTYGCPLLYGAFLAMYSLGSDNLALLLEVIQAIFFSA